MSGATDTKQHYGAIDGLRALSAVGIVLMHVRANTGYDMDGFVFNRMIPSFTNLVFLFMVVSGFSMCCGYYEKIIRGQITLEEFYSKRFSKVWPFFMLLCILDLAISPSANALYEVFANLTLLFGLLPNANIEVIGVGWFLGLVFVFYLLFPFYCFLLSKKRRAWLSFVVALILNYLCTVRFNAGRVNIVYSAVFFLAGGLIFLYRERLHAMAGKYRFAVALGIVAMAIVYYGFSESVPVMLALFSLTLAALRTVFFAEQSGYALSQRYQHGSLSFSYGDFPCDRKNGFDTPFCGRLAVLHSNCPWDADWNRYFFYNHEMADQKNN